MLSQNQMILRHIERFGKISTMEAFNEYGVTRLSARIWDLRHQGHDIVAHGKTGLNRFGEKVHYSEYSLVS